MKSRAMVSTSFGHVAVNLPPSRARAVLPSVAAWDRKGMPVELSATQDGADGSRLRAPRAAEAMPHTLSQGRNRAHTQQKKGAYMSVWRSGRICPTIFRI